MTHSTGACLARRLTFALAAAAITFGATAVSAEDLAIDSVTLNPGEAGNCNTVSITMRNASDQLINQITGAKVITFPTASPFQNRHEKSVFFSAIQGNATMSRTVQGVQLAGGQVQHTVQVVIDFQNQVSETNENNNMHTEFVTPSQTCGGGLCDLDAQSMNPYNTTIPSTYPVNLSVKFRNVGAAQCSASQIQFRRYEGTSASGSSQVVGTANLAAAAPNQLRSAGVTDSNHPSSGTYTYAYSWVGQAPDTNTSNNFLTKTVKFAAPGGDRPTNTGGCDLTAQFTNPSGTSAPAGTSVPFQVLFKNQGSGSCIGAKIKLSRYTGGTCSGYGSMVGGSGNFQTLNALGSGQQQILTWTERRSPRSGTYCYRMGYSPAFNDSNNGNHHPKKKVSFQ